MPSGRLERIWLAGGGAVALLMVLVGYLFFISPQRGETGDINTAVDAARLQNIKLEHSIKTLEKQNKDLARYQSELEQARLALPTSSGLPDFLRTLQSIGAATHANVTSLTVGNPADVTSLAVSAPAEVTGQSKPTATVAGARVYSLPITAQVSGSVDELNAFLSQLQSVQPRAVLISQITESTATSSGTRTAGGITGLTLTMQAFVAPTGAVESAQLSDAAQK
jgi:Tfp pilus assembly protein PilO